MTIRRAAALALFVGFAHGCGAADAGGDATEAVADTSVVGALEAPAEPTGADDVAAATDVLSDVDVPAGALRLTVAPEGNEARYRVREQLVGFDLPNDAIGRTSSVTGAITVGPDGRVLEGSEILVDITGLRSDQDRRDGYLQGRLLRGEQYPTVRLAPTELRGFDMPLPTSGTARGELLADLTVLDVTRPTTWDIEAQFSDDRVTGTASTAFTFEDIQLSKPQVRSVLSVADTIRLEYDFELTRAEASGE